jgi:hypothetical protein
MKCVLSDAIRINELLENIDENTVIHILVNFIVYLLFFIFPSTTDFVCKCCPAYNFTSTNVSEYFNGLLIFLVVLYTLYYLSLHFSYITTRRALIY